jgi:hypothetical protein
MLEFVEHPKSNGSEKDGYDTDQQIRPCLLHSMTSSDLSIDDNLSTAASSYDSDEEYQLAQREWEESLGQLQQLFAVLLPFFGKWLGRRWSHIGLSLLHGEPLSRMIDAGYQYMLDIYVLVWAKPFSLEPNPQAQA